MPKIYRKICRKIRLLDLADIRGESGEGLSGWIFVEKRQGGMQDRMQHALVNSCQNHQEKAEIISRNNQPK
jgi:hypothetical protein